jgi:Domain of unknown function DUF29
MTQELTDLRMSILEGRYEDALALIDELDGMSRKATVRAIKSFLTRMLIHLIKNQVEQRMNNSWAASIRDSLLEIKDLNLQDNKTSYYVKTEDWSDLLEECLDRAIATASVEVCNGIYNPFQLTQLVNESQIMQTSTQLLNLIYQTPTKTLVSEINEYLTELPGGKDWKFGQSRYSNPT